MNYKNPYRKSAIALAVGSVGVLASGLSGVAQAQQGGANALEEVIVTGSRIRRADLDSASPVTVVSREALLQTGLTDIGDLIQSLPSMSGSPIGTTTNNGGNGSVQIDLRGLGVNRTLTLVNGQRIVDGGDFQTIPAAMIDRVEILKDGASAVYGADAVAGVVNIVTRKDFEGVELTAQSADWFDTNGAGQNSISIVSGKAFEGGNFVFGAEFIDQDEALQSDTPWEFMSDSFYIYPQGCESNLTAPYPTGCYRAGSSRIPESRLRFANQGQFIVGTPASEAYQAGLLAPFDGRNYNYAPVNFIQTPYERTNIFAEGNFDITENVKFSSEFRANFRESAQLLAPLPYNSGTDPAFFGTFDGAAFRGISQDNYYLRRAIDQYNAATGAGLAYEPVVDARRRMIETNRRFEQDVQQFQFVAKLEGELNEMNWDLFMNQGYRSRTDLDSGQFSGAALANALGPSADLNGDGRPECYSDVNDPTTVISGCVPLNLFGGGSVIRETGEITATSLTQDMVDYVSIDLVDTFRSRDSLFGGSISGSMFELPGGELGWAAGFQYFKTEFTYSPDSAKATGAVTGNTGPGTDGSVTNTAAFVELFAPVFDNGTQNLNLKAGIRYDDFEEFDGDTTWQIGAEFQALESLKFRATAGTVFRAPTVSDLFSGAVDSFPTVTDPCLPSNGGVAPGCARQAVQLDGQVLAKEGGNPFLQPETGETFTAGLVWTPEFAGNPLSLTADYWEIELENGISALGAQFILDDCYINLNQDSCSLVSRGSLYEITQVLDSSINVSEQGAKGIDIEARYTFETGIGIWETSFLWAHQFERTKVPFAGAPEQDLVGRATNRTAEDGGTRPANKVNATIKWGRDDLSVGWLMEFIDGVDGDTTFFGEDYIQTIDSQLYHDLTVNYTVGDSGISVTAGITNVTDEAPPYIDIGFNAGTDPATYRLFGRGYYARLNWKF